MKYLPISILFSILVICSLTNCERNDLSEFQPIILNNPDNFLFQVTDIENVTDISQYLWANSGTRAKVNQSSLINDGSAILRIHDADGIEVYYNDLNLDGNFTTSIGRSGTWLIQLDLSKVDGDINFSIQKG